MQHNNKSICVDLDGVLAQYDGWKGVEVIGDPIAGAQSFVAGLRKFARVIVFTTRCSPTVNGRPAAELVRLVGDWLTGHGFEFDEVYSGPGKPMASAYIDDRAVICRPEKDIEHHDFDTALRMCRALVDGHELGSQGSFSNGSLNDEDEGDLKLMVSTAENVVRIDFGKPVAWLGLPKEAAVNIANALLKHARAL